MHIRVGDSDAGRRSDITRGGLALAALAQIHDNRLIVFAGEHDALDVQQDFGNVQSQPLQGWSSGGYGAASCQACSRNQAREARW